MGCFKKVHMVYEYKLEGLNTLRFRCKEILSGIMYK